MKSIKRTRFERFLLAFAVTIVLCGFGCEDLVGPPLDCEQNHKGTLKVKNKSSYSTYRVVVNGTSWGTFKPGKWEANPVTAGVTHVVEFYFANSNRLACSRGYPNVPQCEAVEISCDFEGN